MGLRPNDRVEHLMGGVLPEIAYTDLEFYECLSAGTYGTVYRAKYKPQQKIVAVKRVLVLEKEAHVLSLLRHKNIIQFYGAVTHPPNFCIVLEYASEGSLSSFLSDKTNFDLNFNWLLRWATDIALGVHYLHNEAPVKMIHRDLKSKNIVISADETCKLCDFGTSKAIVHTTQMSVVGTIAWMSPEMIQSLPVSAATDAWSYAVVLWELLTRQVPFKNLESFRIAWMVVEENVRLPLPSFCPSAFKSILTDCWQKDPKLRPSFREILNRLNAIRFDETASFETDNYLKKREYWKREIEDNLQILQTKERELTDRETKLADWERRLTRREQNIEITRRPSTQLTYDVNLWTEDDVMLWLHQLSSEMTLSSSLIGGFRENHINGQRLLLLTDNDLRNLGFTSVGYRRQLLSEIDRLGADNLRLINFPPLAYAAKSPNNTDRLLNVTLLFGIYVRHGAGYSSHKWKLLMDIDDADGVYDANALITEVRFVVQDAPYVYKVTQAPFVMRDWSIGFTNSSDPVQCVVTFSDLVSKPRNTKFFVNIDFDSRGSLAEKPIELHIKSPQATTGHSSYSRSSSLIPSSTHVFPLVQSSPVLQGAWQDRVFHDAVKSHQQQQQQQQRPATITSQKSPLWAQIVAGLKIENNQNVADTSISTSTSSSPSMLPRNSSEPSSLDKIVTVTERPPSGPMIRTRSEDPTPPDHRAAVSFYLGDKSKSFDAYDQPVVKNVSVKSKIKRSDSSNDSTPQHVKSRSPRRNKRGASGGKRSNNRSNNSPNNSNRFSIASFPHSSGSEGEEANTLKSLPQNNRFTRSESTGYYTQSSTGSPEVHSLHRTPPIYVNDSRQAADFLRRPQTFGSSLAGYSSERISIESALSPVMERSEVGHFTDHRLANEKSDDGNQVARHRRKPSELSSTSVVIHGGYQKWKWKG